MQFTHIESSQKTSFLFFKMSKNISDSIPTWIKESQFEEILSASVPNFSRIQNFNIKPALGPGENFVAVMLRVKIDVQLTDKTTRSLSYMMKVPHESAGMQEILDVDNFFGNENEVYLNILPKLETLYKDKGLDIAFAPRAFTFTEGSKLEPKLINTVLMEDLGQDGYRNLNRLEGLNFEQTKIALRKIAQYNAAGAHYYRVYGPYIDPIMKGMLASQSEKPLALYRSVIEPRQRYFLANLKNYKNGDKYYAKLEKLFSEILNKVPSLTQYDLSEFCGLLHGDFWINNLLFKLKPNGETDDMRLVDFQMPRFGHPAPDLFNFILSSVHLDYKLKYFDYFISYYHSQLIEHLRILDFTGTLPTLRELHIKLYKYGLWAVITASITLPMVLLDPNEAATSDYLLGNSEAGDKLINLMFANQRFKSQIEQILPWLDNRGLLEIS